jgi:hypothetical protein
MKTQNEQLLNTLSKTTISTLTQQVNETLVPNSNQENHKQILSSADLWNIQRMARPRNTRRFLVS